MSKFENRRRDIEPNHVRTVEVQTLDALIRIDETLASILEGMRHLAAQLKAKTVEVSIPADEAAPKTRRSK